MRSTTVPISWVIEGGHRFDCGPFTRGGIEARKALESSSLPKARLIELTKGGMAGMYHVGMDKLRWVDGEEHGVPILRSADILRVDLTNQPYISRAQVNGNPLFTCPPGSSLITRSGTIGRMAYCRTDMARMAMSQDVLKVVPDTEKIASGYLYAFLSSRYGVPLVVSGMFGSIIVHIEAENIADIPVPRLIQNCEDRAHDLVVEAAGLRTNASGVLREAIDSVERALRVPRHCDLTNADRSQSISSSRLRSEMRFEGYFYNQRALTVDNWALAHPNGYWSLGEVANVFDVPPFKHIYVEPGYGPPFYTSGDLFLLDRHADKYLSRTRTRDLDKYAIEQGWVLLARSGQLGGILGRPQFADSALHQACTSDHVIRIVAKSVPAGYLYAYLATPSVGYVLLTRTMTGASIPALWPTYLKKLPVVKATARFMADVHEKVTAAFEHRVKATTIEDEARRIVEEAIERAT